MRTTITIPHGQVEHVDRIATRLGMKRLQCLNYLITLALSQEQFRGATVETAEGTLLLAKLAQAEMGDSHGGSEGGKPVQVLVTPGQGDKNGRDAGRKPRRSRT